VISFNESCIIYHVPRRLVFDVSTTMQALSNPSKHLVQRIRRQTGGREAPIRRDGDWIRGIAQPVRKLLIRQIKTKYHHGLHQLNTAIKANTEKIIVLAEPNEMVPIYVAHAISSQRQ